MSAKIHIEVAYATPEKQMIIDCEVDAGTPVRTAVRLSGIDRHFTDIDVEHSELGVFGRAVDDDFKPGDGDRIEIYRPLIADPKEVRRQRAAQGLKMKKGGGAVNRD